MPIPLSGVLQAAWRDACGERCAGRQVTEPHDDCDRPSDQRTYTRRSRAKGLARLLGFRRQDRYLTTAALALQIAAIPGPERL